MEVELEGYEPDAFDEEPVALAIRTDMRLDEQLKRALLGLALESDLYWQPGRLVLDTGTGLAPVSNGMLSVMVERRCDVHRRGKNGPVPVRPDASLLGALMTLPAPGQLRHLETLATGPAVRPDGSILPPGYDRASKTLARAVDVERGGNLKELLADLLADYDEPARAAWLAAVAGQLGRANYPIQPGWIISANQPRAGKTMLAQIACRVLSGTDAIVMTLKADSSEVEKGLASAAESRPVVVFDNITHQMASDALEAYISAEHWSYRILGGNGIGTMRTNALLAFTANGASARRDLADRCMVTHLDRPAEQTRWVHRDPLKRADELRPRILGAILDAVARRGAEPDWEDGGRHIGWNAWGRLMAWETYGIDVLAFKGNVDTESDDLEALVAGLETLYGNEPFQSGDVLSGEWSDAKEQVKEALAGLARIPVGKVDARTLGVVFGKYEGRWAGGARIKRSRVGEQRRKGWVITRN